VLNYIAVLLKKRGEQELMNKFQKSGSIISDNPKKPINKKRILFFIIAVVALIFAFSIYPFIQWSRGNVIDGVKFGSYQLSDMSYEQVKRLVNKELDPALNKGILSLYDSETKKQIKIYPSDIDAKFDPYEVFSSAYKIGRVGQGSNNNIFSAMFQTYVAKFFGVNADVKIEYDYENLNSIIKNYYSDFEVISSIPTYTIKDDKLLITPGKKGRELNMQKTSDLIINKMSSLDFSLAECIFDQVKPEPIDIEQIYKNVVKKASDAKIVFDSNGKQSIQVEVVGIDFDLDAAKKTITDLYAEYTIPLKITKPKVTLKDLDTDPDNSIFKDVLASFSTTLDLSLKNRTHNVKLASDKINGTILNSGDEFSFNRIVGPRDISTGFLEAKVYMANEIVDGVGGGICQVSSTLYVASLLSDMEIVERQNHRFTVSYVNPGHDATVSYGIIDYRFKNPYDTPIKITPKLEGNRLTIQIRGTKANNKSYELSYVVSDKVNFTTREKTDTTLKVGTTKVSQGGQQGYTAQLYRSYIGSDGAVVKEFINKSKSLPADRIILVNKPAQPVAEPQQPEDTPPPDTQKPDTQKPDTHTPATQTPDISDIVPGLDSPDKETKNNLPPELGGPLI
jgi:vancomycin resistance protein YoaR